MSYLTLLHPVNTLENHLLLPAGSVLSAEILDELISLNKATSQQTFSILQHGSVKQDLLYFISSPSYNVIFSEPEKIVGILNFIVSINLAIPFLQSLDYFKQHDFYTYRHILTVFALCTLLANDLMPDYQGRIQEAEAGPTHDFGKICVPISILKKSTPLTRTEKSILEHHSAAGYVLISYYLRDPKNISATVARDHHERKDGSGYPRGVRFMEHIVEIVAVSDVYDALISQRPYRPLSYDKRTALEEITAMAESNKISWEVVQALIAHSRRDKPHYSDCKVSKEKRGSPPEHNRYGVISDKNNQQPDTDDN